MDVHKLIHVQRQDPIGLLHQVDLFCGLQRGELDATFVIGAVIAVMNQLSHILQMIQHGIGAILTII